MKRWITYMFCIVFLSGYNILISQSDAMIRMYYMDPAFYNPSLESHSDHAKAILNYRRQWMGMENAPSHQYLSLTAPLMKNTFGLGFRMLNEQHGLTDRMTIASNFAYKLNLSDYQRLSFGGVMNLMQQRLDFTEANVKDFDDVFVYDNTLNMTAFDLGVGLSYLYKTLEVGVSLPNIFASPYRSQKESQQAAYALQRDFMFNASYDFSVMNSKLYFKPHMLYKLGVGEKNDLQIGLISDWTHKYWFGVTYHAGNAFSTQLGMKVYDKVELAYSYEYPLTNISAVSSSSHEICLVYHFNKPHQPNPIPAGGVNDLSEVYQKLNAQQIEIIDIKRDVEEQKQVSEQLRRELNVAFGRITNLEQLRKDMDSVMNDPGANLQDLIDEVSETSNEESSDSQGANSNEASGSQQEASSSNNQESSGSQQEGSSSSTGNKGSSSGVSEGSSSGSEVRNDNKLQGKQTHGPSSVKGIYVIAAGLKSLVNTRPMINNLRKDGHNPFIIKNPGNGWYYVILGVYENMYNAETQLNNLKNSGYTKAWIHVYD